MEIEVRKQSGSPQARCLGESQVGQEMGWLFKACSGSEPRVEGRHCLCSVEKARNSEMQTRKNLGSVPVGGDRLRAGEAGGENRDSQWERLYCPGST